MRWRDLVVSLALRDWLKPEVQKLKFKRARWINITLEVVLYAYGLVYVYHWWKGGP